LIKVLRSPSLYKLAMVLAATQEEFNQIREVFDLSFEVMKGSEKIVYAWSHGLWFEIRIERSLRTPVKEVDTGPKPTEPEDRWLQQGLEKKKERER
jgi:hypothetical protein